MSTKSPFFVDGQTTKKALRKPLGSTFEVIANPQNGQVGAIHLKGSCKGEHPFECIRASPAGV